MGSAKGIIAYSTAPSCRLWRDTPKAASSSGGFRIVLHRKGGILRRSKPMRAPYGLEIIESCLTFPPREERLFCNLSGPALQALASITSPASYPKGATLYVEGQSPRGVFILCSGRVKLSTSSADGRTLILRIAESGDVLGMPGTLTGKPYELTADVLEPTQANFIHRQDFLNFLRDHGQAALSVAQQLGEIYHFAVSEMRNIARIVRPLPGAPLVVQILFGAGSNPRGGRRSSPQYLRSVDNFRSLRRFV